MIAGGESVDQTAIAILPAGAGVARAARLPAGADPDEVRDWFELETIVELPAGLPFWGGGFHRMVRGACAGSAAGRARDRRRVSRGRGRQGARSQHLASAPRRVAARGLSAADRLAAGVGDLRRHPTRPCGISAGSVAPSWGRKSVK